MAKSCQEPEVAGMVTGTAGNVAGADRDTEGTAAPITVGMMLDYRVQWVKQVLRICPGRISPVLL